MLAIWRIFATSELSDVVIENCMVGVTTPAGGTMKSMWQHQWRAQSASPRCSSAATWMISSSMRRPTGDRGNALHHAPHSLVTTANKCVQVQGSGEGSNSSNSLHESGSVPNLLMVCGLARWLPLNLLFVCSPVIGHLC